MGSVAAAPLLVGVLSGIGQGDRGARGGEWLVGLGGRSELARAACGVRPDRVADGGKYMIFRDLCKTLGPLCERPKLLSSA